MENKLADLDQYIVPTLTTELRCTLCNKLIVTWKAGTTLESVMKEVEAHREL